MPYRTATARRAAWHRYRDAHGDEVRRRDRERKARERAGIPPARPRRPHPAHLHRRVAGLAAALARHDLMATVLPEHRAAWRRLAESLAQVEKIAAQRLGP